MSGLFPYAGGDLFGIPEDGEIPTAERTVPPVLFILVRCLASVVLQASVLLVEFMWGETWCWLWPKLWQTWVSVKILSDLGRRCRQSDGTVTRTHADSLSWGDASLWYVAAPTACKSTAVTRWEIMAWLSAGNDIDDCCSPIFFCSRRDLSTAALYLVRSRTAWASDEWFVAFTASR